MACRPEKHVDGGHGAPRVRGAAGLAGIWLWAGLTLLLSAGCVSTGERVIRAEDPRTLTWIARFELHPNEIVVHSAEHALLVDATGRDCETLKIGINGMFGAGGFNCYEEWRLLELPNDRAVFDVRGRYYGCTDVFAIVFGIPSQVSHWRVIVVPTSSTTVESDPPKEVVWFERGGR